MIGKIICILALCFISTHAYASEVPSAFEEINALTSLKESVGLDIGKMSEDGINGISHNSEYITGLGNDYTKNVEYDIDFGKGCAEKLIIDANVTTEARIRIYHDCPDGELIQEFKLEVAEGEQTFELNDEFESLSGQQNICIAFDNNLKMEFYSLQFVQGEFTSAFEAIKPTDVDGKSDNITVGDYIQNAVDGDWLKFENVDFAEGINGIYMRYSNTTKYNAKVSFRIDSSAGTKIAEFTTCEISSYKKVYGDVLADVQGIHDLYVLFESDFGSIQSFTFMSEDSAYIENIIFSTDTYDSVKSSKVTASGGYFGGWNNNGVWVKWEDVDFGNEAKLRYVDISYGLPSNYGNSLISIRIDSPTGTIIAQAMARKTGGWTAFKNVEVPVTATVTGVHDIYLTVETSSYLIKGRAGNIKGFRFYPADGVIAEYSYEGYHPTLDSKAPLSIDGHFVLGNEFQERLFLVLAIYASDGKLINIDVDYITPEEDINISDLSIEYKEEYGSDYTVRGFIWRSENSSPIEKITVMENLDIK